MVAVDVKQNPVRKLLNLSRPLVMGVLNITPDSFYANSRSSLVNIKSRAQQMIEDGVDIIDIGGESTRPFANPVSLNEELDRVLPVIEELRNLSCPLSIDTYKPEVMQNAVSAGASMINDIYALQFENALETAAVLDVPVCLMHTQGSPTTMQVNPNYENVTAQVIEFLKTRKQACLAGGIPLKNIILDPGFGFGKTGNHNLTLMNNLATFKALDLPLLIGVSRKSMIGQVLKATSDNRLYGGLALATIAVMKGAKIIRTHDVKPTVDVLKMTTAVNLEGIA